MNKDFLTTHLITYIGNKRKLLPFIETGVKYIKKRLNKEKLNILDGFSGSGTVSRMFKEHSNILYINDIELYSYILNKCYLSNISNIDVKELTENINYLNNNKLTDEFEPGIIQKLYAPKDDNNIYLDERVFYTSKNAKIIDNIRRLIDIDIDNKKFLYLAPLLVKASIHANTSGVFKGFYKNSKTKIGQFGGNAKNCLSRITKDITLDIPIFSDYECPVKIYKKDINKLIIKLDDLDMVYYDPPYNQHPYGSNYFMLNIIAKYEKPQEISKVSGIPKNWNKSLYNKKNMALGALDNLLRDTQSKYILISYNNEGFIKYKDFKKIAKKYGKVGIKKQQYNTFRGSRNLQNRSIKVDEMLIIIERK